MFTGSSAGTRSRTPFSAPQIALLDDSYRTKERVLGLLRLCTAAFTLRVSVENAIAYEARKAAATLVRRALPLEN